MTSVEKIRLQKLIATNGLSSRRQAEEWIRDGLVLVNGVVATIGMLASCDDDVIVNGQPLAHNEPPRVYWLLNKPDQTITSKKDELGRPTIFNLPSLASLPFRVNAVGRLDFRTEGLLILTNDGDLHHRLCHPTYKLPRTYEATVNGKLNLTQLNKLRKGIPLKDGAAMCKIKSLGGVTLGASKGHTYLVTVTEGRNRLVRRLFEYFELKVVRLNRIGFGDLWLDESLKPGRYRQLSKIEIKNLKKSEKSEQKTLPKAL